MRVERCRGARGEHKGPSRCDCPSAAAFTLVELLVAIAVILILLAVGLPHLESARLRCKIGRTMSDMRGIGTALEMYRQDWNRYPDAYLASIDYLSELNQHELDPVTTPIAYISRIPDDPFKLNTPPYGQVAPIDYYNSKSFSLIPQDKGVPDWTLTSYGPNRRLDYVSQSILVYSPTNGTSSAGDLMLSTSGWRQR